MIAIPGALATEVMSLEEISSEEIILEEMTPKEEFPSVATPLENMFSEDIDAKESALEEDTPLVAATLEATGLEENVLEATVPEATALEATVPEEAVLEESTSEQGIPSVAVTLEETVTEEVASEVSSLAENIPSVAATLEATELEATELEATGLEVITPDVAALEAIDVADVVLSETDSTPLQNDTLVSADSPQSLWLSQSDSVSEAAGAPPKFGTAGKQRWYLQSAVGVDLDDDVVGLVGAGVTHFFYDYHSLNLELNGLYFDQPGANAAGLNLNLLLRSHWIRGDNWSVYVDGGVGILQSTDGVPSVGSTFNFTPQLGGGATFALNDDVQRLMVGMRWHHTSSADTYRPNPGLDVWLGYVGINFPL
ncbi:MAG: acyloxyacyl hydrolase [Cyanobacteria bacterium J06560_5]